MSSIGDEDETLRTEKKEAVKVNGANIPETENIFTVQRFNSGLKFFSSLV